MLIRFSIENFRSFNEEAVFSMIPGRMQKHKEHIISFAESGIDALRIALLYGANASGKSNLVRAMDFARTFIVEGRRPKQSILFEPFRLNEANKAKPSRFEFEFMVKDQIYAYGFLINGKHVLEEWLYSVNANEEFSIFERKTNRNNITSVNFNNINNSSDSDRLFLEFVKEGGGARPNQLLLTTLADNDVKSFEPMYEWFQNILTIIFPHSQARSIQVGVHKDKKFSKELAKFLYEMHTGIDEVCTKLVDPDSLDFPMDLIIENLDEQDEDEEVEESDVDKIMVVNSSQGRYLIHRNEDGLIEAHTLGTRRYTSGNSVDFDLFEESDGTKRLLDLFPVLYGAKDRVFVIDELERSLHPNLVRRFIEMFLKTNNKDQLIVTTHGSTLLDLALLRRDEIWFVEKSNSGSSVIYSLEEFKPRHDLDIRKGYLQGRFGAIPVFGSSLNANLVEA